MRSIKEVVLTLDDGTKVKKELPMNTPVEIAATLKGTIRRPVVRCSADV